MHDTSIHYSAPDNRMVFEKLRALLWRRGFALKIDPHIKKDYPSLAKTKEYYHAQKGKLEARLECHRAISHIEFYQNVVFENPAGGQYDFDRVQKMPYLVRVLFLLERGRITSLLKSLGLADTSDPTTFPTPNHEVMHRIKTCGHWHGEDLFGWRPRPGSYGADKERNSKQLLPGETKFYYHWATKRLSRGVIWYNLNNMWYVVSGNQVKNIANFDLFDFSPDLPRRRAMPTEPERRRENLTSKLTATIKAKDFKKASGICLALANV